MSPCFGAEVLGVKVVAEAVVALSLCLQQSCLAAVITVVLPDPIAASEVAVKVVNSCLLPMFVVVCCACKKKRKKKTALWQRPGLN